VAVGLRKRVLSGERKKRKKGRCLERGEFRKLYIRTEHQLMAKRKVVQTLEDAENPYHLSHRSKEEGRPLMK